MSITPEQIEANWNKYRNLCEKTLGNRAEPVLKMLDHLGERLALCPASGRKDYHNAMPGGLVDHSLRVLNNAMTLVKSFGWDVPKDSLVLGCLFHDLGKCSHLLEDGNLVDYYIPQESEWHREKIGEMYKHNPSIPYMSVPHRGVWMLQRYGVNLSYDEFLSIILNDGWVLQENKAYCLKEPILAHIVMTADYIATYQEKH